MQRTEQRQTEHSIARSLLLSSIAVGALALILAIVAAQLLVYEPARRALAARALDGSASRVQGELATVFQRVEAIARLRRDWGRSGVLDLSREQDLVRLLGPLLAHGPNVSSMAIANASGREVLLFRDAEGKTVTRYTDPEHFKGKAIFRVWPSDGNGAAGETHDLDYDARKRPWFIGAQSMADPDGIFWTEPFVFRSTQLPGLSAVVRWHAADGQGFTSTTDITLLDLSRFTHGLAVGKSGFAAVLTADGRVVGLPRDARFASDAEIRTSVLKPVVELGVPALLEGFRRWQSRQGAVQDVERFDVDGVPWLATIRPVSRGGGTMLVGAFAPESDFAPDSATQLGVLALIVAAALLMTWLMTRRLAIHFARPLRALAAESERIGRLELDQPVRVDSPWREVASTARAQEVMRRNLLAATRQLEDTVRHRTAELAAANLSLRQSLEQSLKLQSELVQREKLAALGSLVAGVAHELNSPIGNALLVAGALAARTNEFEAAMENGLRRSVLTDFLTETRQGVLAVERNLERAGALVSNFKRLAVDQSIDRRRSFRLRDMIEEVVVSLGPMLKQQKVVLTVHADDNDDMDSYPGTIGQVLMNLINNAVVHAFDGRDDCRISVEAEAVDERSVRLRVRDNGCGIPPENVDKIFDPFFTTRFGQGGSGLGLHIVYSLVSRMLGGRIEVGSRIGEGTTFTVTLPRVPPRADTPDD